ncbi:MAG: hypothetical protein EOP88_18670 [Verrucomicrobiaceae bacterium]|nr:MAG: hypothetical protein EOP88_18670 [Verrucomicrobiaceae bacterium]
MFRKKIRRVTVLSLRVLLVVGGLLLVLALLPGSVEGNYKVGGELVPQCLCTSKSMLRLESGQVILYQTGHPPAQIVGRYNTGKDGMVEIHRHALEEGAADILFAKVYPRYFFTLLVAEKSGNFHWLRKKPPAGWIGKVIQDQVICRSVLPSGSRLRRTVYDRDLKMLRMEASVGPDEWTEMKAGEPLPQAAFDWRRLEIFSSKQGSRRSRADAMNDVSGQNDGEAVPLSTYSPYWGLRSHGMSKAVFGSMMLELEKQDPSPDPPSHKVAEFIIRFEDKHYLVKYENNSHNTESAGNRHFRFLPLATVDDSGKSFTLSPEDAGGTSRNKEMLAILEQAAIEAEERDRLASEVTRDRGR